MKKLIIIIVICLSGLCVNAKNDNLQDILDKRIKFYPLYFNALQLTPEQASEFEYITEVFNEKYKNSTNIKQIIKISKSEDKEVKKFLDKRQKARYRIIRHLERKSLKNSLKTKDYYKSNPRMSIFGDISKK